LYAWSYQSYKIILRGIGLLQSLSLENYVNIISLLKAERDKVARQLNGLEAALAAFAGSYRNTSRSRRKMSAASRRKIAAAQRARWAKQKGKVIPIKTKRRISPEGLANIRAAAKKRWAKEKQKKAA